MAKNRSNTFWLSYSDLMTSLFFIIFVLFLVCFIKFTKEAIDNQVIIKENKELKKQVQEFQTEYKGIKDLRNRFNATKKQLDKIKELNNSIREIDDNYFKYDAQFKRHTLKNIEVSFNLNSSNIQDIDKNQLEKLLKAGEAIVSFMKNAKQKIPEAQYLLILEGQSSKDFYIRNYELSYERALALIKFWSINGIAFDSLGNCEVLISGSGQSSRFRIQPDIRGNKGNQRFVIHIIPKPGIME